MDLADFEDYTARQEEGLWVSLINPITREETGARWLVAGFDSQIARTARQQVIAQLVEEMRTAGLTEVPRDEIAKRVLARVTLQWENMFWSQKELELSYDSALKVLNKFPWIVSQIDQKVSNSANFIKS